MISRVVGGCGRVKFRKGGCCEGFGFVGKEDGFL